MCLVLNDKRSNHPIQYTIQKKNVHNYWCPEIMVSLPMVDIVRRQCCQFCSQHHRINVIGGLCDWLFTIDLGLFCKNFKVSYYIILVYYAKCLFFRCSTPWRWPAIKSLLFFVLQYSRGLYTKLLILNSLPINLCDVRLTSGWARSGSMKALCKIKLYNYFHWQFIIGLSHYLCLLLQLFDKITECVLLDCLN